MRHWCCFTIACYLAVAYGQQAGNLDEVRTQVHIALAALRKAKENDASFGQFATGEPLKKPIPFLEYQRRDKTAVPEV